MTTSEIINAFGYVMKISQCGDPFNPVADRNMPVSHGGLRLHFGPKNPNKNHPRDLWYSFDLDWYALKTVKQGKHIGRNVFDLMFDSNHLTCDVKDAGRHMILVVRDFEDAVSVHKKYANNKGGLIWRNIKKDFDGLEVRFRAPSEHHLGLLIARLIQGCPNDDDMDFEKMRLVTLECTSLREKGLFMPWLFNMKFPSGVVWSKSKALIMMRPLPLLGSCL